MQGPGSSKVCALVALVALAATAVGLGAACATTGHASLDLGDSPGGGHAASTAPVPLNTALVSDTSLCQQGTTTVDWSPVRRISRVEYDNMVRDLLGDTTAPATGFVPESPLSPGVNFQANTYTNVSALIVQQYAQAAETLAQAAVSDAKRLNSLLPCRTQDDACAQQFIASFAARAFRGQLDATEASSLFDVYASVKAEFDFATGIQALITAVLESPRFLYVLEFGQGTPTGSVVPVVPLASYEVAGRLALFLWRSVPDDALMQAGAAGQLATPEQIEAQAVRMIAPEPGGQPSKAIAAIDDFTTQWLQLQGTATLGKDSQFTAWNGNQKIGAELRDEALTDVSQLVLAENAGLAELLTSPSSYVNADLAGFYGASMGHGAAVIVADPSLAQGQTSFTKTDLAAAGRTGVLTSAGVLATQAHTTLPSSVLRGKLVREQILCDEIPPPPPNVPPPPASVSDGGTTRSLFEAHATTPGCVPCHQYMDPIGFGFGHFDATGAFQKVDANGFGAGPPLDVSGQINPMHAGELTGAFEGASDLTTRLAAAPQVAQCFVVQELRYALSRVETKADACSAQRVFDAFGSTELNIQKLLLAIVKSDAFRYRSVDNAGSACR